MVVVRWILVSLPLLALAAWGLSYRWGWCFYYEQYSGAISAGDAWVTWAGPPPLRASAGFYDSRVDPNDGAHMDRMHGPLANLLGFRWGTGVSGGSDTWTLRIFVVPLWAVVLALAVPAWYWRPRRRPRGRGFEVEAAAL
jgi:hypothetical protein